MKNKIVLLLISYILFISVLNRDGIYGSSNKDNKRYPVFKFSFTNY